MVSQPTIRLTVPGTLAYRNVAVRLVAESCRLVSAPGAATAPTTEGGADHGTPANGDGSTRYDLRHPFDAEFVSAFAEIFNNIVIHAYARQGGGDIELSIGFESSGGGDPAAMAVEIRDHGTAFDIDAVASPDLDSLPEGGMGIHIARALLDVVEYEPGPPNLWRLVKRLSSPSPR